MGARGPLKDPNAARRKRDGGGASLVIAATPLAVPEADKGWLKATATAWSEFWASPVAPLIVGSDVDALRRLFTLRDEQRRAITAYQKQRLTEGSKGQLRLSPMLDAVAKLEAMIRPLEDRFAGSLVARARAGIQIGNAARTLEGVLNEVMNGDADDDEGEAGAATVVAIPASSRRSS